MTEPLERDARIIRAVEMASQEIRTLLGDADAFRQPSLELRGFEVPELGFLRLVSWCYCLLRESGRDATVYLSKGRPDQDWSSQLVEFQQRIEALRTFFQHHLDDSPRSREIRAQAGAYLSMNSNPQAEINWLDRLTTLSDDVEDVMARLAAGVRHLREGESSEIVPALWEATKARTVAPQDIDEMILEVARSFGLYDVNPRKLRDRHIESWRRKLEVVPIREDAREYLRRLIEAEFVNLMSKPTPPVNGNDVMDHLGLAPGPQVAQAIKLARDRFDKDPGLSKEELLRAVAEAMDLRYYPD